MSKYNYKIEYQCGYTGDETGNIVEILYDEIYVSSKKEAVKLLKQYTTGEILRI